MYAQDVSAGATGYAIDCAFEVTNGTNISQAKHSSGFGDWTVCCGTFVMDKGNTYSRTCVYQNETIGDGPEGLNGCDTAGKTDVSSPTSHFIIGQNIVASGWFTGRMVGVWGWLGHALTQAEITAFAAPWKGTMSTQSTYCAIVGNQWICFSAGL